MTQGVAVRNIRVLLERARGGGSSQHHIKDLTLFLALNGSLFQVLSTSQSWGETTRYVGPE